MKILVTGGAGFIGRYLVDFLLDEHEVTIYDNLSNSSKSKIKSLLEKGSKFEFGDILDYQNLQKACVGYDMIIHLAAKSDVKESVIYPNITNEVNVSGTRNVLKCCVQNKIKKLIFASSAAVYGECDFVIDEETKMNAISPYGKSKLIAEKEIENFAKDFDINAISLRMFNVYDKGDQQSGVISKFIKNITKGDAIIINGDGNQTRDFVFIDDVISAFDCAIKQIDGKKGKSYNIASGDSISIKDLAKLMIKKSGREIKIKYEKPVKGDIKNSSASIILAQNELGFKIKHSLSQVLSEIFTNSSIYL